MQLTGERQLQGWYRDNNLPAVCLLYGEDSYQIEKHCKKLLGLAVTDFPDFNLYRTDGRAAVDMDELADAALSLPFMSKSRGVLLDDLNLSAQDSGTIDKLMQLLKSPSESTCLIITVRTNPLELKKKGSKGAKLWELCDKVGLVCNLPRPARADVARAASTRAVKLGSKLDSAAASLLADYCGGDILRALGETDKLSAYTGGAEITEDTVRLLVEPITEAKVFELADKLLRKDLDGALTIVSDLIFLQESPVSILTILSMSFADLYRAAAGKRAGIPTPQAQKALGYFGGSAYRYQKALENQSRLPRETLGAIVLLLADADTTMKDAKANPVTVLETTVTQIDLLCAGGSLQ